MRPFFPLLTLLLASAAVPCHASPVLQDPPKSDPVITIEEQCGWHTVPLGTTRVGPALGKVKVVARADFLVYRQTTLDADGAVCATGQPILAVAIKYTMGEMGEGAGEARRLHLDLADVDAICRGMKTQRRLRLEAPDGVTDVRISLSRGGWSVLGRDRLVAHVVTDPTLGEVWVNLEQEDNVLAAFQQAAEAMRKLKPLALGVSVPQ